MRWILGALFLSLSTGCGSQALDVDQASRSVIEAVPAEKWKELASRRIFFAHKSVGQNIVEGLNDLVQANPQIGLRLIESRNPGDFNTPALAHAVNGMNGDPIGKIAEFRKALDQGLGESVDIAFVKFCWADFTPQTNASRLFTEYKQAMSDLKADYPRISFVHLTVPLTVRQSGPKALIKRVMGRPVFGFQENIARNEFNNLLIREYQGKEPVFNIAAWESSLPDGSRREFTVDGQAYLELIPEYTPDSGHLNPIGRRWVAAHLLEFLANLPSLAVSD